MSLYSKTLYHVYNQGNNKEALFKEEADYELFLFKLARFVKPNCELLCYCLMPNHFHILLLTTDEGLEELRIGSLILTRLTNGFRLLQSGYAHEFNKKSNRSGSLFRQKAKFKLVDNGDPSYSKRAFRYVLYNPKKASLVNDLSDWKYCSYSEIKEGRENSIFDYEKCKEVIQFDSKDLETINNDYDDPRYFDG